jgi:wyosine [tRNA(Phe)-imidazoG37] synthetase (radical SAM superfamily)
MQESVFGPVPSRRLGFSLGVDIIPRKYCTFDCIYCQIGKTAQRDVERRSFSDPGLVVKQVIEKVEEGGRIDFISLSGSGEPTLSADLGGIIRELKRRTTVPIAVITNGSLLFREDVRREVGLADLVLPSLDAADDVVFKRINRPHPALSFSRVLEGLKTFREEYRGTIWLEIMLIKNINNSTEHLAMFKDLLRGMSMDKVQLNTVSRPPRESTALALDSAELSSAAGLLGAGCEVIAAFGKEASTENLPEWTESVLATLQRRSLSLDDIVQTTGVPAAKAQAELGRLAKEGKIRVVRFNDDWFYTANDEEGPS